MPAISAVKVYSSANNKLVTDFLNNADLKQLQIAFMFLVILDNNEEIIPVQAQIWLTKKITKR